jgi:hypothetical protein
MDLDGHGWNGSWRKRRDSNPRYPFRYASFQDWSHQPLGHSSCLKFSTAEGRNAKRLRVKNARCTLRLLEAFYECQGFGELGELGFFGFEFAGVDAAAETTHADGMLEVKHLVVEQVLEGVAWA